MIRKFKHTKTGIIGTNNSESDHYLHFERGNLYEVVTVDINKSSFCLDHDGIWKRIELRWLLDYFLKKEDYEKCAILKELIDEHYIADDSKQKELNDKLVEHGFISHN